jgi:hypothetical protein
MAQSNCGSPKNADEIPYRESAEAVVRFAWQDIGEDGPLCCPTIKPGAAHMNRTREYSRLRSRESNGIMLHLQEEVVAGGLPYTMWAIAARS